VDTKSVNNTTLLHFLEKTISKHFAEMAAFLDELEKPADAYRGLFDMSHMYTVRLTHPTQ
jgi:cytokinesis protein